MSMPPERETVVVDRRGPGSSGLIIGILVALAVIAILYFAFFNNGGGAGGSVDVDVPAVSVDVTPDGQ